VLDFYSELSNKHLYCLLKDTLAYQPAESIYVEYRMTPYAG